MAKKDNPAQPAELDEHHGHGGSYVVEPATGKRVLKERTQAQHEVKEAGNDNAQA